MSTTLGEARTSRFSARATSPRAWVAFIASILGFGVATYLTIAHYSSAVSLVCADNGVVNCEKVTTSAQSVIFHVPVAVLGLCFFIPMLVLNAPAMWRSGNLLIARARLAYSVIGIGTVLYLVYAELFIIHAICLWCTSVHVLTFIIFCTVVSGWQDALYPEEN